MNETILLVCPNCKENCRTRREIRPGAKMRCPNCDGVFYFVVHGNGAVELRPVDDEPVYSEPATQLRLPPRVAGQAEKQPTRRIFTSRRRNRPIGGYAPFEKSRSYIGMFAFWIILVSGVLAASWYVAQISFFSNATGKDGANVWQNQDEGKRKEFQARQKKKMAELEKLKKQPPKGQLLPVMPKVDDGRQPGDQTHHD